MYKLRMIDAVYTHTAGETTCLVLGGVNFPSHLSIRAKREYAEAKLDWLRSAIIREPRGHSDLYGGIVTTSSVPEADFDVLWMDGGGFAEMCGHGTIALGMVLVALGWAPDIDDAPTQQIRFQTTAGVITVTVGQSDTSVDWCQFQNVPAFVAEKDVRITVDGVGELSADIVYAGVFIAVIRWPDTMDLRIGPEHGRYFGHIGYLAKQAINEKVRPTHPVNASVDQLDLVTFYHEPTSPTATYRCVHTYRNGKTDRSPGGTGTSAMMAHLESRGQISLGQKVYAEGLLGGGLFEGCLVEETAVGNTRAVVPTIKGVSEIISFGRLTINPNDPIGLGYDVL